MALVIGTNTASLNAQRQLNSSAADMSQAMERLSSGKRINSAADDAAGLAISNRMTSQVNGLARAVANANDGVSMLQTAEGAMDETTNILQRMRELSIQSANGIYSDSDRSTLDAEVQQLKAEIDRIAETTTFNGKNLLDGSLGEVNLQVGSQANQTVSIEIGQLDTESLGGTASADVIGTTMNLDPAAVGALVDGGLGAGITSLKINDQDVGDLRGATTMDELLDTINNAISGVEVSAFTEVTAQAEGTGILKGTDTMTLTLHDTDGSTSTYEITNTGSMEELAAAINSETGGVISASLNEDGRLVLANDAGAAISVQYSNDALVDNTGLDFTAVSTGTVSEATANHAQLSFEITDNSIDSVEIAFSGLNSDAAAAAFGVNNRVDGDVTGMAVSDGDGQLAEGDLVINGVEIGDAAGNTVQENVDAINAKSEETGVVASIVSGAIELNSVDGSEISIEASAAATTATGLMETNNSSTQGDSVADIDISTQAGAQEAIETIDAALEQINSTRADMGAMTNRLNSTVSNLMNVSENTAAARSRIQDADFAAETANLSKAQVLQQASQAMLAQANAAPQQVLSLLR